MTGLSRRTAISGLMAIGLLSGFAASAQGSLAMPSGPMRLVRRIERGLSGGAEIIVERAWNVRFSRQGRGMTITGEQSQVKVDAPAALSGLAQIEESRSTEAMFPILLSEAGVIIGAGTEILGEDIALAAKEAERMIAARPIGAEAKADQMRYLALLQQSAGKLLERLPPDLFFPTAPPRHTIEPVQLADGLSGEFEVSYDAQRAPGAAWLARAERVVVTRIGASERRSSEVWTMAGA